MDEEKNSSSSGTLYIVATPIGNLEDITLRALKVLEQADLIAAEDTRHTGRLLAHFKINNRLISCHNYNEKERSASLLKKLAEGFSIALVSDAGTPSVSDPGFALVKDAIKAGIPVVPIPGVSAAITALSASGLPTDHFSFVGFMPKKKKKCIERLTALAREQSTLVFYESPRRIITLLEQIEDVMGDRVLVVARELTKYHEEFLRGKVSEILPVLKNRKVIKGECTLLVSGARQEKKASMDDIRKELQKRLNDENARLSEIAKDIAKQYKMPKSKVYEMALKIKKGET